MPFRLARKTVSIHAPARGATSNPLNQIISLFPVSIHAPARGATWLPDYTTSGAVFQSTLPHEERRHPCASLVRQGMWGAIPRTSSSILLNLRKIDPFFQKNQYPCGLRTSQGFHVSLGFALAPQTSDHDDKSMPSVEALTQMPFMQLVSPTCSSLANTKTQRPQGSPCLTAVPAKLYVADLCSYALIRTFPRLLSL